MKATPETVTVALDLYFKGISMRAIVDHLKQFYGMEVSHVAIYKWIRKYISMMKKYCDQLVPRVSGIWHEMVLNVRNLDNHENQRWAWNVIDNQSRYWLAVQITEKREIADARNVLAQASSISQTRPMAVVTDELRAYQDAIRQRNKVMRGLDEESTAQTMMNGMRIYYNFIRPHTALKGKTPAQKAKIETDRAEWMSLIKKASQHQRFQTSS